MRNLLVYLLIVFTLPFHVSYADGVLPDWVLPELNKYPIDTFLLEVGYSDGTGEAAFENAVVEADKKVARKIIKQVHSIIRLREDELEHDIVKEHYSAVLEDYCSARQVAPRLQLKNALSVRNPSLDLGRIDSNTYAIVYVKRDKLKKLYHERAEQLRQKIIHSLEIAKAKEASYDINGAVRTYLSTYPLYEALKEAEIVQIGAEYMPYSKEAFKKLANYATDTSEGPFKSHRQVIKRVEELEREMIVFFDDIARVVDSQLKKQLDSPISSIVLMEPLIYEDSEVICAFGPKFISAMQGLGWPNVGRIREFKQTTPKIDRMHQTGLPWQLTSSCWKNGDEITVRATVRNVKTGEFLASSVVRFLNSKLREPLIFTPTNYSPFIQNSRVFDDQRNEAVVPDKEPHEPQFPAVSGLEVEIWTDKGRGSVAYVKGETMKVFGRVNQPAYLRLLYILADDRKYTLLQNNYYIGPSQVNTDVEIDEFVCVPPFGAEILVVAARIEKFPPIETFEENGYFFLVAQDPESAARGFWGEDDRGMKRKDRSKAKVVVTTMEK